MQVINEIKKTECVDLEQIVTTISITFPGQTASALRKDVANEWLANVISCL